ATSAPAENTIIHLEGAPGLIFDPVQTSSLCVEPYFPEPAPSTGFIVDCDIGLISPDDTVSVAVVFELGPSGTSPSSFLELTTTNLENNIQYLDPQLVEFTCTDCPDPLKITSPPDNTVTNDNTPNIHGNSQANHNISLNILGIGVNNTLTTTSNPGGIFTFNNISPALPDGIYTITATDTNSTDALGNPLPVADMITLIIDTGTFVTINPLFYNNYKTGDDTPTIFGTAEPNSIVDLYIDGDFVGTTNSTTGAWSITSLDTLSNGFHQVSATVTDPAGNTATSSPVANIEVDTTVTVSLLYPNGITISDNTPEFSGTTEPNSLVEVFVNGTSVGSVNSTGASWAIQTLTPLLDGFYNTNVTATDDVGNTNFILGNFIVDTATFVIIDPSLNGLITNDNTPNIFGTAEPDSTVSLFVDGIPFGTDQTSPSGEWDKNTPSLSDGIHTINANVTDVFGNTASAIPVVLTIDTIVPTAIMTTLPGPFTNQNPIPFTATFSEPVFNSTGGSTIPIKIIDGALTPGSISTVDNIVFTFTVIPDAEGMVKAKIENDKVFDAVGNQNIESNYATISYDETDPIPVVSSSAAPTTNISPIPFTITFDEIVSGLEESEISIFNGTISAGSLSTTNNKVFTFSVIPVADGIVNATIPAGVAQDQAGNDNVLSNTQDVIYDTTIAITILSHVNGDVTNDNTPLFFGTSDPGANIEVTYDTPGIFYAANVTDGSGIWQAVDESNPIPDGPHLITANATDAAGNTVSVSITIDTMPPMVVLTTTSPSPTNTSPLFFNATFSEIVTDLKENEIVIQGGVVDSGSLTPDENDETLFYTFTVTPIIQGIINATIPFGVAEDHATNLNTASNTLGILYDSVTFVTITSPISGTTTSDNTPTFSGTAEPGALVEIFSGATLLGNVNASAAGSWSFTPGSGLSDGTRAIKAEATDALGNQASTTIFVVIDTIPPVITLNGSNPQIIPLNGVYTELNATTDDGSPIVIDSSAVDVNTLGSYFVFYNSTDAVGNVAALVNRTVNVVDTQIPIITLLGDDPQIIELGDGYTELNATAFDVPDGDISGDIVIDSTAFVDALGSYSITYDVTDSSGNDAVQKIRTVDVVDTTAPVILLDSYAVTIELGSVYNPANANATDNDPAYVEDIAIGGDT
ncbi:MAG: DUF5011 domain-containing protein, partial [Nitrosopumilus sp.]|nr:DUF5011 domain-containing protein [Nitrosopumilus sp.]